MNHFLFLIFYFSVKNGSPGVFHGNWLVVRGVSPGRLIVVPKAGTGHKMQFVPVVLERYIVRDISLTYF